MFKKSLPFTIFFCVMLAIISSITAYYADSNITKNNGSGTLKQDQPNPWQAFYPGRVATYADQYGYHTFAIANSIIEEDGRLLAGFRKFIRRNEYEYGCDFKKDLAVPGAQIIIQGNGIDLLVNHLTETISIKTLAEVNENWVAWQDNEKIIKAMVTKKIEGMVLGTIDSIKHIKFLAIDQNLVEIDHALNGIELQLSKSFGFVTSFNFNNFPFQSDIFDLIGCTNPNRGV